MKKWLMLICIGIFLFSCSSDNDSGSAKIYGDYELESFSITYPNGVVIKQNDVDGFYGKMTIHSSNLVHVGACIQWGGEISCDEVNYTLDGNYFVAEEAGCYMQLPISFDYPRLTWTSPSGICGSTNSETSVWVKVSSEYSEPTPIPESIQDGSNSFFGSILNQ